jgi:hypothetical protein
MPLFATTISLYSALPPGALLDRIRALAMGKSPMPRQSRWRSPVMWWLREQPDAIRLMPLSPPGYRAQQPSFIGTIEPEGSGSRVRGRVTPYALSIWITAFLLVMFAGMTTAGVVQQFSRHGLSKAMTMALIGIGLGAAAVSMLRLGVSFAAADIRQLLETAASSDPHQAIEESTSHSTDAIVPTTIGQSTRGSFVLRAAAAADLLIALFLITSSFVSSRVGRPVTLSIAAIIAAGAGVLLVIANRFGSMRRE